MLDYKKIDAFLAALENAKDDDELRRIFTTYNAEYDLDVPTDPYSEAYRNQQFSLYESLAKKKYVPQNEVTEFDVAAASIAPFPYCHGSCDTVGNQLMAIGFVIKALALPKGAKILEFGSGWGNTTIALAKMGFDVTAVDIENNFCRLIEKRASLERINIQVVNSEFNYIKTVKEKFDAVLFFECFHHAENHLELMAEFDRVLKPRGRICFGAEPITHDFPLPWGLRMDGESLWAIRKNGWLELGYNKNYFKSTMAQYGWILTFYKGVDSPWSSAIIAQRKSEVGGTYSINDGSLKTQVGKINESGHIVTAGVEGYLVYGPYIRLPEGLWTAAFDCYSANLRSGSVMVDVVSSGGTKILATKKITPSTITKKMAIDFSLEESTDMIEVRVWVSQDALLDIGDLVITLD